MKMQVPVGHIWPSTFGVTDML